MCHKLSGVELDSSPSFLLHYPGPNSSTPLRKPRIDLVLLLLSYQDLGLFTFLNALWIEWNNSVFLIGLLYIN